jgi:hypothetical protein
VLAQFLALVHQGDTGGTGDGIHTRQLAFDFCICEAARADLFEAFEA